MIVIITHNGYEYISACLSGIRHFQPDMEILVVDTCSTDESYFTYLQSIQDEYNFLLEQTDGAHYDFPAYRLAVQKHPRSWYFFHHDSLVPKMDFYNIMPQALTEMNNTVQAFIEFPDNQYDTPAQRMFVEEIMGESSYISGIWGSCFGASWEIMRDIDAEGYLDKVYEKIINIGNENGKIMKSCSMERLWPAIIRKIGAEISYFEPASGYGWQDRLSMDEASCFSKLTFLSKDHNQWRVNSR